MKLYNSSASSAMNGAYDSLVRGSGYEDRWLGYYVPRAQAWRIGAETWE